MLMACARVNLRNEYDATPNLISAPPNLYSWERNKAFAAVATPNVLGSLLNKVLLVIIWTQILRLPAVLPLIVAFGKALRNSRLDVAVPRAFPFLPPSRGSRR